MHHPSRAVVRSIRPPFVRWIATVGLLAVELAACRPGFLPCDDAPSCSGWDFDGGPSRITKETEEKKDSSAPPAKNDAAMMGVGGMDVAGGPAVPPPETPVPGCIAADTLGAVETKVLAAKCAAGCHDAASTAVNGPGDLKSGAGTADFASRMLQALTVQNCTEGKKARFLDMMLNKMDAKPACPTGTGTSAGTSMAIYVANDAPTIACVKSYVRVLTGAK